MTFWRVVYGHLFPEWADFPTIAEAKRFRRATGDPEATIHRIETEGDEK